MTDQPRTYLEPLHDELDRLRKVVVDLQNDIRDSDNLLEQAEARVDQLTDQLALANDTLRHRATAVNATGATNDQLRATLARIEKVAADWECSDEGCLCVGRQIRSILDHQEPAK